MNRFRVVLFLALIFGLITYPAHIRGEDVTIQKGGQVSFDYTLTVDGEVVDSSEGKEPLQYTHGEGKIIPGLSKQLEGMRVGEEKKVEVLPEEAYGQMNPDAFQEVPRSTLPADLELQVGMMLQVSGPQGTVPARVAELKESSIVLDFNHPLAGKALSFQVKIVSIN